MSIPNVPLHTWILFGSLVGSPILSLCLFSYFFVILIKVNVTLDSRAVLLSYLQIMAVCLIPAVVVAAVVGLLAKWRHTIGDRDSRFVLIGAGAVTMLPSLALLLISLNHDLSFKQAVNILFAFGLIPSFVAIGTTLIILRIAIRQAAT